MSTRAKPPVPEQVVLSTAEVAFIMGRPPQTVKEWRQRKVGPPYFRLGRVIMYRRSDFQHWLESQPNELA